MKTAAREIAGKEIRGGFCQFCQVRLEDFYKKKCNSPCPPCLYISSRFAQPDTDKPDNGGGETSPA